MSTLPHLGELPSIGHQYALLDAERAEREIIGEVPHPVARVQVLLPHPHLDKVFDYLVPRKLDSTAVPGARVQVRVADLKVDGYIVERSSTTDSGVTLRELLKVYSGISVLTPHVYDAARQVAYRYAGSVADVLSLAIPQRHARAEREFISQYDVNLVDTWGNTSCINSLSRDDSFLSQESPTSSMKGVSFSRGESGHNASALEHTGHSWSLYAGGHAFLRHLASGGGPWAICQELPGSAGYFMIAEAIRATLTSGRGALVIVPSAREARYCAQVLSSELKQNVALMVGDEAHEQRYTAFLEILSGLRSVVVGTRSALWAPVRHLGLCVVMDDAAPTLRELHRPYYNAREVAAIRARCERAALLVQSTYISPQSLELSARTGAVVMQAEERFRRSFVARVSSAQQWTLDGAQWSRIPESAFAVVRAGLERGPVLVVVPQAGYLPLVACENCRRMAQCSVCGGGLSLSFNAREPRCSRCNSGPARWRCQECGSGKLRAIRVGSHRTAEEIGRAFPGVGILVSGAQASGGIINEISRTSRIVVATPGAEPRVEGGYAAGLVLDSRFLQGDGPGSDIEFVRKISRIASRISPSGGGGHLMFAGGIEPELVSALGAWKQGEIAAAILEERRELLLPPSYRWASVKGGRKDVRTFLALLRVRLMEEKNLSSQDSSFPLPLGTSGVVPLVEGVDILGPLEGEREGEITVYIRPNTEGHIQQHIRLAHREYAGKQAGAPLRIEIDPVI